MHLRVCFKEPYSQSLIRYLSFYVLLRLIALLLFTSKKIAIFFIFLFQ